MDPVLSRVVEAVRPLPGMTAIVLGGSRARGTAGPRSDYGVGLYYEPDAPFDLEALRGAIAPLVDDPSSTVTEFGGWGPWINGGGNHCPAACAPFSHEPCHVQRLSLRLRAGEGA